MLSVTQSSSWAINESCVPRATQLTMLKSPAETGFSYCALSFHWLLLLWFEVLSLVPTHASMFSWDLPLLSFGMDVCISGNIIYFKNLSHLIIYIATLPWLSWTMVFSPWTVRDFFFNCMCVCWYTCVYRYVCMCLWRLDHDYRYNL